MSSAAEESPPQRSQLEAENAELREGLESEKAKLLASIHKAMLENPKGLARAICEGVISDEGPKLFDDTKSLRKNYSELAQMILSAPEIGEYHDPKERAQIKRERLEAQGDHILLSSWVGLDFYWMNRFITWRYQFADMNRVAWTFFLEQEEDLSDALRHACELVYHGIPVYERNDSGSFIQVPYDAPLYTFLHELGRRPEICHSTGSLPDWSKQLYINREELDVHDQVFFRGDLPSTEEGVAALRIAFRRHIGKEGTGTSHREARRAHRTTLLRCVDEVIKRYYGDGFDPSEPDTWPKKADVTSWLITHFDLSANDASHVDAVTRPDSARRSRGTF